jgi:hypothetical protein
MAQSIWLMRIIDVAELQRQEQRAVIDKPANDFA